MTAKERVLSAKVMLYLEQSPSYSDRLGIRGRMKKSKAMRHKALARSKQGENALGA